MVGPKFEEFDQNDLIKSLMNMGGSMKSNTWNGNWMSAFALNRLPVNRWGVDSRHYHE